MLADGNNPQPSPSKKPNLLRRVLSVFIKATVLLMLLFVFDKLLPSISKQTQSFVLANGNSSVYYNKNYRQKIAYLAHCPNNT